MAFYLCGKEKLWDNLKCVRKSVIRCALYRSVEVAALSLVGKILSEYWNNRTLLMRLKNPVQLVAPPSCQKLINEFLLFEYSWLYISVKRRSSEIIWGVLERTLFDVHCAGVLRLQLFYWARKSSLNIKTIEFC